MNKRLLLHPVFWAAVVVVLGWGLHSGKVFGEPMAVAKEGGIRIVVYTEDCSLKEVKNLPKRATWTENGKTIEGCVGLFGQIGLAMFYFADKTVVPVPMQLFEKVTSS